MSGKAFGRDEMNALIGGGRDEELAGLRASHNPAASLPPGAKRPQHHNPKQQVDISKLSAAETAALLMEKTGKSKKPFTPSQMR